MSPVSLASNLLDKPYMELEERCDSFFVLNLHNENFALDYKQLAVVNFHSFEKLETAYN
jgi:hypothetical protein